MRKVVVCEFMSLDGVVQAPAYADEEDECASEVRGDDGVLRTLRLVSSTVTNTGAILATYARPG